MNLNAPEGMPLAKGHKAGTKAQSIECIALGVLCENTLCSLCLKNIVFRDAL